MAYPEQLKPAIPQPSHVRKVSQGSQVSKEQLARENPSTLYDRNTNHNLTEENVSNISRPAELGADMGSRNVNTNRITVNSQALSNKQESQQTSGRNPLLTEEEY